MLCPKCGKENNPFAKLCEDCGAELPEVQMELTDDEFVDENQELKVSEAAPVSDAVRSPQHIGNMPVENLGDQETFEPQMLSFNTQAYNANQANLGYIKPNDIPIVTSQKAIDSDGFVPSSAFSNLKEPKKKKSKLRMTFIIISILVILSIISFFVVKAIIENVSTKFMREHTAQFVVNAYQLSTKEIIEGEELIKIFSPDDNKTGTTKTTVMKNGQSISTVSSFDKTSHRYYFSTSTNGTKNDVGIELFANTDKCSLKYTNGQSGFDYYLPLSDLRTKAVSSSFGPQGSNMLGITQEQYDSFMDIYEYVYDFILKDDETKEKESALKQLFETICTDIDNNSEIEIKDEQVSVEGSEKSSVYLITRTIKGKQVFIDIYNDIQAWIQNSEFIKGDMKSLFLSYIEELNPSSMQELSSFELKIENYINKSDNSLMQTVIDANVNGEKSETRIYLGTEPSKSDKIIITTNAIKSDAPEDPNQSSSAEANQSGDSVIEISREKTTLESTYTLLVSTPNSEANYILVRNNSTGEYTLESTVKASATAEPVTTTSTGVIKYDAFMLSWSIKSDDGTETEYYYSNRAEMNEISSNNNLLDTSLLQLGTDIQSLIGGATNFLTFGGGLSNPLLAQPIINA